MNQNRLGKRTLEQERHKLTKEIMEIKKKLVAKVEKNGMYENFGQQELNMLEDKYSDYIYGTPEERKLFELIGAFDNWCLDFVPEKRSKNMENKCTDKKVTLKLVGLNGNAFSLMGAFSKQAKEEKWSKKEIDCVLEECQSSDYNHLLRTLVSYCEPPEDDEDIC